MATEIATVLNCSTDTSENMVNCVKQFSAEELIGVYTEIRRRWGWHNDPIVFLEPVIESEDYGIERFLTKDPLVSLQEGDIADVPIIIGTTQDEFANQANCKFVYKIPVPKFMLIVYASLQLL